MLSVVDFLSNLRKICENAYLCVACLAYLEVCTTFNV